MAFDNYEKLPFAVVITDEKGKVVYKNERAREEMPALRRGSYLSRYSPIAEKGEFVKEKTVFGKPYFVSAKKLETGEMKYALIDDHFNCSTVFSTALIENSVSILESIEKSEISALSPVIKRELYSEKAYLRFLKFCERKLTKGERCDIIGMFSVISDKLKNCGLKVTVDAPKRIYAEIDPYEMIFVLVNILRFVSEYTGLKTVKAHITETRKAAYIRILFCDCVNLIADYDDVISGAVKDGLITFLPLISALAVFRSHGRSAELIKEDGVSGILLTVPFILKADETGHTELTNTKKKMEKYAEEIICEVFEKI